MAIPPPGDASGGTSVATAGDNLKYIRVPDSENWQLVAIAAQDQTNAVRVNIYVGWGQERALLHTGIQTSTSDWVFFNSERGVFLKAGQIITLEFKACVLNDVLVWNYYSEKIRK
jgi:hypothetical protein